MRIICAALLVLIAFAPARAQQRYDASESDLALLSVNALIGGASAGASAWLRGRDVSDSFLAGALGGGLSFAGKRVATIDFPASGLVGRQVAALGHNVIVNAGEARPLLSELWLPLGPLQLRLPWGREDGAGWNARLDLTSTAALLYAASIPELELDWGASAELGVPVFAATEHQIRYDGLRLGGLAVPGVILLSGDTDRDPQGTLGHEAVHVIQQDFMAMAWSYPLEGWLRERLLPEHDWLDAFPLGGAASGIAALLYHVSDGNGVILDLMEHEAYSLTPQPRRLVWR